jgi:hypothetical protein
MAEKGGKKGKYGNARAKAHVRSIFGAKNAPIRRGLTAAL